MGACDFIGCCGVVICVFAQREGQRLSCAGGSFIGSLWLLMVICVVLGAAGVVEWLDSFYVISYVTLLTVLVKYIPMVRYIYIYIYNIYI